MAPSFLCVLWLVSMRSATLKGASVEEKELISWRHIVFKDAEVLTTKTRNELTRPI